MHRLFEVEDVIREVVSHLPKKDAFHFSLTHKLFYDIIEAEVWTTVDGDMLDCLIPETVRDPIALGEVSY